MAAIPRRASASTEGADRRTYAASHSLHRRSVSSPAERFSVADGIVSVISGVVGALFFASRATPSGRVLAPLIALPIAGLVAIETSGYSRAVGVSTVATSAAVLSLEATDHLTGPR